ncbi:RNA-guided endonuclease TnpB family protein [uncultured Methanobrevibacter sp.]|jgi:putative transposase|uniref:RNA-guided endonuclease InsQ/TnpB family protein n=2 Tax=uncultured Methanobrevibacter sp. TaxID=253161 RepID=UPI0025CB9E84|nr:RNA-guided endonuclease TnpB family protein [uncultured Methanobrevibacter sp.]
MENSVKLRAGFMVKEINKGLKLKILPNGSMVEVLEQNMGNARFIWNNLLGMYFNLYLLFNFHGYPLYPNIRNFNAMLKMLKQENAFLYEGESTSQQQVFRDLNKAFTKFFKEGAGYPRFKSKKNPKQSFRIQKNGNNIRITNRRIRLAKLGYVHYRTSTEYKKLLKTSKINNVTIKRENGKYYAIVNITTTVEELEKTGKSIGIDLGLKNLATLSNGQEITNLDLKREDKMIQKYQKKLSRQKYMSKNYQKTLKKYYKWTNRKNNKIQNAYHQLSKYLITQYDIIAMENLNIKGMFKNKKWAPKLQKISLYKLLNMIKYKAEWYGKTFIQVNRFYPSTKTCNTCGYKNKNITLKTRQWTCPICKTKHHRDINAAKNILNESIKQNNLIKKRIKI